MVQRLQHQTWMLYLHTLLLCVTTCIQVFAQSTGDSKSEAGLVPIMNDCRRNFRRVAKFLPQLPWFSLIADSFLPEGPG